MDDNYRKCIDIGFEVRTIGRHRWTSRGIYGQLTLGISDVRCVEWQIMNLVMVF